MRLATSLLDFLLWLLVQFPLLVLGVSLSWTGGKVIRGYLGSSKLRRWLKGEPAWQQHDVLLDIQDPAAIQRWREAQRALADHCRSCDTCWPSFSDPMRPPEGMCGTGSGLLRTLNNS